MSEKPDQAEALARDAADAWLSKIDEGDTAHTWAEASSVFRAAVSEADWATSLSRAQGPIGKPLERTFESAEYKSELPGAPDGHYVILTYKTRFEHKEHGQETVVPQLDTDGAWRVSGYFVK